MKNILFILALLIGFISYGQKTNDELNSFNDTYFNNSPASKIRGAVVNSMNSQIIESIGGFVEYDITRSYIAGKHICLYNGVVQKCIVNNGPGAFNQSDWSADDLSDVTFRLDTTALAIDTLKARLDTVELQIDTLVLYVDTINDIQDTLVVFRDSLNNYYTYIDALNDSVADLRTDLSAIPSVDTTNLSNRIDSLASATADSLSDHWTQIYANQVDISDIGDSLNAHVLRIIDNEADINDLQDTATAHNTRILNNTNDITALDGANIAYKNTTNTFTQDQTFSAKLLLPNSAYISVTGNDLKFSDVNNGESTLSQLAAGGSTVTITNTYVGYGNALSELTSSNGLIFDYTNNDLSINNPTTKTATLNLKGFGTAGATDIVNFYNSSDAEVAFIDDEGSFEVGKFLAVNTTIDAANTVNLAVRSSVENTDLRFGSDTDPTELFVTRTGGVATMGLQSTGGLYSAFTAYLKDDATATNNNTFLVGVRNSTSSQPDEAFLRCRTGVNKISFEVDDITAFHIFEVNTVEKFKVANSEVTVTPTLNFKGALQSNGAAGITQVINVYNDGTSGNLTSITITNGIITAVTTEP